jgi:hypothetical protein
VSSLLYGFVMITIFYANVQGSNGTICVTYEYVHGVLFKKYLSLKAKFEVFVATRPVLLVSLRSS